MGYDRGVILATERLSLLACPLAVAQALAEDACEAGRILGAAIPPGWPLPPLLAFLPLYAQELLHDPSSLGWGLWISVLREEHTVVGDAGFKGRPDREGTVEIGYGVAPAYRRRGYATEAVQALIAWAFGHPEVKGVVAECSPGNSPSLRVLRKAGFRLVHSDPDRLRWEMLKPHPIATG